MDTFTVVFTYSPKYTPENAHQGQPARLFYDCTSARSSACAVAQLTPKCPGHITDVIVFRGEHYDLDFPVPAVAPETGS